MTTSVPGTGISYTKDFAEQQKHIAREPDQIRPKKSVRPAIKTALFVYTGLVSIGLLILLTSVLFDAFSFVKLQNKDAVYTETIQPQSIWHPSSPIQFLAYPATVYPGETALVEISAVARLSYSVIVYDDAGRVEDVGLLATETDFLGRAAWVWSVPADAIPGTYYIEVSDRAGNINRIDYSILDAQGRIVGDPPGRDVAVDDERDGLTIEIEYYTSGAATSSAAVYVAGRGEKCHKAGCHYIGEDATALTVDTAVAQGYTPCSSCNP